jgi:hypothetical protein
MSNSIAGVNQLVSVIRSQLAGRLPAAPPKVADGGTARAAPGRYAEENLAALIDLRVRQIGRDDPQRGRKAFRVFLEAVLLSHLGEQLANDARFYQLLDDVQGALEADPAANAMVASAIAHLLSTNG